jgi:hypothetical protein
MIHPNQQLSGSALSLGSNIAKDAGIQPDRRANGRYTQPDGDE